MCVCISAMSYLFFFFTIVPNNQNVAILKMILVLRRIVAQIIEALLLNPGTRCLIFSFLPTLVIVNVAAKKKKSTCNERGSRKDRTLRSVIYAINTNASINDSPLT